MSRSARGGPWSAAGSQEPRAATQNMSLRYDRREVRLFARGQCACTTEFCVPHHRRDPLGCLCYFSGSWSALALPDDNQKKWVPPVRLLASARRHPLTSVCGWCGAQCSLSRCRAESALAAASARAVRRRKNSGGRRARLRRSLWRGVGQTAASNPSAASTAPVFRLHERRQRRREAPGFTDKITACKFARNG